MPLDADFINSLEDYTSEKYSVFIETGTHHGDTVGALASMFTRLFTMELSPDLVKKAHEKHGSNQNITFINGDSMLVFSQILKDINTPSIIFLDAHWDGGDTARGMKDCPLAEELNQIMTALKTEAIVIVNDSRLFKKGPHDGSNISDWSSITREWVNNILEPRTIKKYTRPSTHDPEDRLVYHICSA